MADILHGTSGHSSFAPLSNAQTVSICKHLQDQIDELGSQCNGLREDLKQATDSIKAVGTQLNNYSVDDIRDNVTRLDSQATGLRNDLGRTSANLQRLQTDHDTTCENLASLTAAQKVADIKAQKTLADLEQVIAKTREIGQTLQNKVAVEAQQLRESLSMTDHQVGLLNKEMPMLKANLQFQKDGLQGAQDALQALRADFTMAENGATMLEEKVADLGANLKETRHGLQDAETSLVHLQEDHGHTKQNLITVNGTLKKTAAHVKQAHERLEHAMRDILGAKAKLDCTTAALDVTRRDLEGEKDKLRTLRDSQDMAQTTQANLAGQLAETSASLNETKRTLKETNALVLPNLQMESTMPRGFGMGDGRAATARDSKRTRPRSKERARLC